MGHLPLCTATPPPATCTPNQFPAEKKSWPNAGLLLDQHRRRWTNNKPIFGQSLALNRWTIVIVISPEIRFEDMCSLILDLFQCAVIQYHTSSRVCMYAPNSQSRPGKMHQHFRRRSVTLIQKTSRPPPPPSTLYFNPLKPEFTFVIFIHYKPRIAAAILDL